MTTTPGGPPATPDPTETSVWRPVKRLFDAMDEDIARLYRERGVSGVRPRYVLPLIKLGRGGPMTIRALAEVCEVTHSAMSQTVTALVKDGMVARATGTDARTRRLELTERARAVVPLLEAEWRATEQAVTELEAEVPYPLTRVIADLEAALARRSFHDRITALLVEEPR